MIAGFLSKVALSSTVVLKESHMFLSLCRPFSDITGSEVIAGKNNVKENICTQYSLHVTLECQDSIDILLVSTFKGALYNIYNLLSFDAACPQTECNASFEKG